MPIPESSTYFDVVYLSVIKARTCTTLKLPYSLWFFTDLVQKLLDKGKQLLAVKFIFEFELTEKFPPVPILKDYVKESKKAAKAVCKEGKNSLRALVFTSNPTLFAISFAFRFERK